MENNTLNINTLNKNKVAFFRYKKSGKKYLLTNIYGGYIRLSEKNFTEFIQGKLAKSDEKYWELQRLGFIKDNIDFNAYVEKFRVKTRFLNEGPTLHILVTTLRCNHNCVYCHASPQKTNTKNVDMNLKTAKKTVDLIFQGPSKNIAIEFQGGEPMLNWKIIKFVTEYSAKKAEKAEVDLQLRLITNFSLMTEEKLNYCYENKISFSTSLDGPEYLHNKNRVFAGNSYKTTVHWLKRANELYKVKKDGVENYLPGVILTTPKESLKYPKEIVDEYINNGCSSIFIRQINPFGSAGNKKTYSAKKYISFYKKSLDYIIEHNKRGTNIKEMTASFMLTKILLKKDPNFLELRSPCGGGIGQIAYNYNGDIFTCDEGRMLSEMGDDSFKIGNVFDAKHENLIDNDVVKSICSASCLEIIPYCSNCVYNPYCGVCPIYNYSVQGNIFGQMPTNERCKINMAIFDYLFKKMEDKEIKTIFYSWVSK